MYKRKKINLIKKAKRCFNDDKSKTKEIDPFALVKGLSHV